MEKTDDKENYKKQKTGLPYDLQSDSPMNYRSPNYDMVAPPIPLPQYPGYWMNHQSYPSPMIPKNDKVKKRKTCLTYDDEELSIFLLAAYYGETPIQCWERFQEKFPNSSRQKQSVQTKYKETKIKLIDQVLKIRLELNAESKPVDVTPTTPPPISSELEKYKKCCEFIQPCIYEIGSTLVFGLDQKFFELTTLQLNKVTRIVRVTYKKPMLIGLVSGTQSVVVDFHVPNEYDIVKRYKGDHVKGIEVKVRNVKHTSSTDFF